MVRKRIFDERIQIYSYKTAGIAALHGNLGTGVGRNVPVTWINRRCGIPVLAVPENDSRLCRIVSRGYYFIPQLACAHLTVVFRVGIVERPMMREFGVQLHSLHKFVRNTHGYVGSGHFLKVLFDRYKILDIWMRHIHSKHQGSAASVLRHLTCGVGKTLHERNGPGRSAGRVRYHRIFRTQTRNVHAYSATALKQLYELFIGVAYTAIRVLYRRNYHTVGQRSYYLSIAKGRHDAALRHYVAELVEQGKYFFFTHFNARFSVIRQALLILRRIFFLDTREFGSHAPGAYRMEIVRADDPRCP